MDAFTTAYIEAMFSTEEGEDNLQDTDISHISQELMEKIEKDCAEFQRLGSIYFTDEYCNYKGCSPEKYAGHDFWLTRNGHGCGFWDGDWNQPAETALTTLSESFGETWVYLGDDGKIYS